uniref:Uncharacterized protein n=1 Tax=viral metagenome TaxID=1070528 RepID=A0A6C0LRK7_9ZZZZ
MESFINGLKEKFNEHFKNPLRFSSTSKKLINEIVNLIIESNDYYESHKSKFHIEKNTTMPKCNMIDIIPANIIKHIENMKATNYVYKFNIHSKQYTVSFYTNLTDEIIQEYIKKVYMLLYIVYTYANKDCSKNLNIYLYLTDLKKVLPIHTKVLKEENVNTAFTTSCKPHAEIVLFRHEEWFKVLAHECFHCNGLDFSNADTSDCDKTILDIFPVSADVRLYETYCEMWGEMINVLFISYFSITNSMKRKENLEIYIHKIVSKGELLLQNERMFSMFQSSKILHFFGIDYKQLYDKQDMNSHRVRQIKYKEETSVLSYYILKNIYIFFMNEFVEWCVENNKDSRGNESLVFTKTKENMNSYCDFIKCRYTNYKFVNCVFDFEKWLDCSRDIHPSIYNSMRMTVYGDK